MISKTILLLVWKIVESLKCIHTLKKKDILNIKDQILSMVVLAT